MYMYTTTTGHLSAKTAFIQCSQNTNHIIIMFICYKSTNYLPSKSTYQNRKLFCKCNGSSSNDDDGRRHKNGKRWFLL